MKALITGGCGFIGTNTALRLAELGFHVTAVDDLSRPRVAENRRRLEALPNVECIQADIRDADRVAEIFRRARPDVVIHLAAQVAATTSVRDPRYDFEVNALGTFNVLEAIRRHCPEAVLINSSTNKVYGALDDLEVRETETRYYLPACPHGIAETRPLDFHSPYGCSKGAADQYVLDYARIYGLRSVSLRQSCIYGPHQYGMEDQGWLAWMALAHSERREITLYGTGKQVRDVLFVDDLVDCYLAVIDRIDAVRGEAFNIGAGPQHTTSLLEYLALLAEFTGREPVTRTAPPRPGDQKVYISDIRKATERLGWRPKVGFVDGIGQMLEWLGRLQLIA